MYARSEKIDVVKVESGSFSAAIHFEKNGGKLMFPVTVQEMDDDEGYLHDVTKNHVLGWSDPSMYSGMSCSIASVNTKAALIDFLEEILRNLRGGKL